MKTSIVLVITCFLASNAWVFGDAYPPIEGAAISRSPDNRLWFHIGDDPLSLWADGSDGDCNGGTVYYDYIALANTQWSGSADLSETTGLGTTWTPQAPNSAGVTITAVIDDYAGMGYGDDSSVSVDTPALKAYRVGVDVTHSWTSDDLYAEPTTTASDSDTVTLWEDSASSSYSYTGGLGHYLLCDDNEDKLSREKVIKMTWALVSDPTTAELGTKRIKSMVTASDNEGVVEGEVCDNDLDDGTSSISVGISGGTGGFSAGVSTTITWGTDTSEGYATAGWAFSGDQFSDLVDNESQTYSLMSKDFSDAFPCELPATDNTEGSVNQTKPFVGLHGAEFKSKYEVEGRASCKEHTGVPAYGEATSLRTGTYDTGRPICFEPAAP